MALTLISTAFQNGQMIPETYAQAGNNKSPSLAWRGAPNGTESFAEVIKKRDALRVVAERHGVDLRTAALQFSAAASEAVALVVGVHSAQQISEDWNSIQAKIPEDFWVDLLQEKLIDTNARLPKRPEQ